MKPLIPLPTPGSAKSGWKDRINVGLAFLLVISPVISTLLPSDFFDEGLIICPSRRFLGLECPGCGLTRATQHFLHGEWEVALDYNPLVVVVVPILAVVWVVQLMALIRFFRAYRAARQRKRRDSPPVPK
jgi:hypothetical protein